MEPETLWKQTTSVFSCQLAPGLAVQSSRTDGNGKLTIGLIRFYAWVELCGEF